MAVGLVSAVAAPASADAAAAGRGSAQARAPKIAEVPVTFTVRNTNTSRLPCASDGATYAVRGHLVGRRAALLRRRARAVTVYYHGAGWGEFFWRFKAVPGYDYAAAQARAGHVSLVIDRLGYLPSGRPAGTSSCYGSQADVAHQIIQQLRAGDYGIGRGRPPRFRRVALAAHGTISWAAQVEAFSYRDIDALVLVGFGELGPTPFAMRQFSSQRLRCMLASERADGASGPPGYVYDSPTGENFVAAQFFNADPAVAEAATPLRRRDPCGDLGSSMQAMAVDPLYLRDVRVPVLLVNGDRDGCFPPSAAAMQRGLYANSPEVTQVALANTGHAVTLERTRDVFRTTVSRWLRRHGLGPRT